MKALSKEHISLSFFQQNACHVARMLLGATVAVKTTDGIIRSVLTDIEAYDGPEDKASHAYRGKTPRNEIMYARGGHIYVYLIYGMYYMLNIVTGEEDYPAAVLIRGTRDISGPGRITRAWGITKEYNGMMIGKKSGLWFEKGLSPLPETSLHTQPRCGVSYAHEWAQAPYRFIGEISFQ